MTRISFALLSLFSVAAFAQTGLQLEPGYPIPLNPVGRNERVDVHFTAGSPADTPDVSVDFTVDRGATIAQITSPVMDCAANGGRAHCTAHLLKGNEYNDIDVTVLTPNDLAGGTIHISGSIQSPAGPGSAQPWQIVMRRYFLVTTVDDFGAGSLRQALGDATRECRGQPCQIDFEIPSPVPASGWFTITPRTPLPALDAQLIIIDGNTQTAFTGDTNPNGPEIEIDGSQCACFGITIAAGPDPVTGVHDLTIRNLAINGFAGSGILTTGGPRVAFFITVDGNYLGTDPTGTVAVPNLRGIMSAGSQRLTLTHNVISGNTFSGVWIWSGQYPFIVANRIGVAADGVSPLPNGASGVFLGPGAAYGAVDGNTIANNRDFGVAISPEAQWMEVRGNSMKNNGQAGIDFGLDLATPNVADDSRRNVPNAPVLTSARFDPASGSTIISGHIDTAKPSGMSWISFDVDVYRSSALDAHGMAQGEQMLSLRQDVEKPFTLQPNGDFTYVTNGDLTGQYVAATVTRDYALAKGVVAQSLTPHPNYFSSWQSTSEFSAPLRVGQ